MRKYLDFKWVSLLALNVLLIVCVCVKKQSVTNHNELNTFSKQLVSIQNQLKQPVVQPDLSPITQNLNQLNRFIQQLQNKDDHQLGEMFTTEQVAIKKNWKALLIYYDIWMRQNNL